MLSLQKLRNPLKSEQIFTIISMEKSLSFVSLNKLKQSITKGNMYVIKNKNQNIGFIEIYKFNYSWIGIFSFYIQKTYRNKRVGTKVMQTIINYFSDYNIYLATNSSYMIKICAALDFTPVKLRELPSNLIIKLGIKRIRSIGNTIKLLKMQRNRSIGIYCLLKTF